MDIKEKLGDFKKQLDQEMSIYLDRVISDAQKKDPFMTDALRYVKTMVLSGGKRLRPALMYYGYLGCGGKEKKEMLKTAISIELIHAFLLIHDDIMDRDMKRHGVDTLNARYQKIGKRRFRSADARHFGDSMAIIIGDMIGALGNQIIFESQFDAKLVMKALSKLQSIVSLTVIGQSKDVLMEYKKKATEKEVLEMYEYKTAKYTLEGPLHLGAILGGAGGGVLADYTRCSIPLGIAFQIQDDILGIFGSEKKLGKSIGSDIKEQKQTLLLVKAKELGTGRQRKELEQIFKKDQITKSEVEIFQRIMIDTGSLDYSKKLAERYILTGKKEIEKMSVRPETKDFLLGIADYMVARNV